MLSVMSSTRSPFSNHTSPIPDDTDDSVVTSTSDASTVAEHISRYCVAHGLPPVCIEPRLSEAAKAQALAVAEAGTSSHGRFASRMAAFGIGGSSAEAEL